MVESAAGLLNHEPEASRGCYEATYWHASKSERPLIPSIPCPV